VTPIATLSSDVRRYGQEYACHAHDYVQIMFAVQGRMELELDGHSAFADTSCGLVIPAGVEHGFMTTANTRMFVLELPNVAKLSKVRRFAVTSVCRQAIHQADVGLQLSQVLDAPSILLRRGIDLTRLNDALDQHLHETWSTARMAQLFFLSAQHFHSRLLELTGHTPQDYLRNRRFDAAQHLLRQGMSLEATASHVGYRSASALSFALKRDRQWSTRQLRRR